MTNQLSRREFLKITSTGSALFTIGFFWSSLPKSAFATDKQIFSPNLWVTVTESDTVMITMHKSELGQKIWTALPQIVAEELEVDWTKIKIVQGNYNPEFGSQSTGGSKSIRDNYDLLRKAGATAREMLITAAANTWNVPRSECRAENSAVYHDLSGRKLSYGQLIPAANQVEVPIDVELKDPRNFKIIGIAYKSLDAGAKIDGSAIFGFDYTMPGMLIGVIERIPVFGGGLADFDPQPALAIPGVKQVFPIDSGIVVLAEDSWSALQGRKALKVEWDLGDYSELNSTSISNDLRKAMNGEAYEVEITGDVDQALKESSEIVEAEFEFPYLDHAPMEPLNCTALVNDNSCEIWVSTQNPKKAFREARSITGFSNKNIKVNTLRSGGGFGRRLQPDYVTDAVETALQVDVPVKIFRTRNEDIKHGMYRPATYHRMRGGLDKKGRPTAWVHRIAGQTVGSTSILAGGAGDLAYSIPNIKTDLVMTDVPVPIGPWRSVGNTQNAHVNECFTDYLAAEANTDPLEFRKNLLPAKPRHLGVLNLAAEKAGWGKTLPKGHYMGIAVHYCFRSYAAVVAEISIDKEGILSIHKMTCAVDCGIVINPDGVYAQLEGGVYMGLTAAIHGAIKIKNGQVEQSNFHNYKLLTMDEAPPVSTYFVESSEKPTGVGEPPVPPTPPALVNAIFAATGKRITKLPIGSFNLKKSGII